MIRSSDHGILWRELVLTIWNMSLQENASSIWKRCNIPSNIKPSFQISRWGSFVYRGIFYQGSLYQKSMVFLEECVKHILCSSNNITSPSEIQYYLKTMALYSKMYCNPFAYAALFLKWYGIPLELQALFLGVPSAKWSAQLIKKNVQFYLIR